MKNIILFGSILIFFSNTQSNFVCNGSKSDSNTEQTEETEQKEQTKQTKESIKTEPKITSKITVLDIQEIIIGCMDFKYFPNEVIINSKEEYNDFLNYKASHPNCSDIQLPEIDFSNKTLLGYKTTASGCQAPEYTRIVNCDNTSNTCTYTISIKENGLCEKGWPSMNWVAVQKIPDGYKINYVRN